MNIPRNSKSAIQIAKSAMAIALIICSCGFAKGRTFRLRGNFKGVPQSGFSLSQETGEESPFVNASLSLPVLLPEMLEQYCLFDLKTSQLAGYLYGFSYITVCRIKQLTQINHFYYHVNLHPAE